MCNQCSTKPVYEFTNKRKVCKTCFIRWFEKKFLYTIRKFDMVSRGEIVFYKKEKDFRSAVLEEVLKMFGKNGEIKIATKGEHNKLALADTTDIIARNVVKEIVDGKLEFKKYKPVEGKIIRPLCLFLDEEMLLYAKLKGLKFDKVVEKKNKIDVFIDELEKKHLEVKHAIVKGYLGLN